MFNIIICLISLFVCYLLSVMYYVYEHNEQARGALTTTTPTIQISNHDAYPEFARPPHTARVKCVIFLYTISI